VFRRYATRAGRDRALETLKRKGHLGKRRGFYRKSSL
jgi:hypothetical protein